MNAPPAAAAHTIKCVHVRIFSFYNFDCTALNGKQVNIIKHGKDTQTKKNASASTTTQHLEVITIKNNLYLNNYVLECGPNTFVCKKHKKKTKKQPIN